MVYFCEHCGRSYSNLDEKRELENHKKIVDKLETYTIEQLEDFVLLDYWNKSKIIDDKLQEYLSIRQYRINKAFEWTPEDMEKLLCLNQRFIDCWEKLFSEAQGVFNALQKRINEKDDFLHDFEMEAKIESLIMVSNETGEWSEIEDCIEEVLIDSLRLPEVACAVNCTSFNSRCVPNNILYLDKEQNWNHEYWYFKGKFDNHFISQAIHDLYDHTFLSLPDILKINSLWVELQIQQQHFQDLYL